MCAFIVIYLDYIFVLIIHVLLYHCYLLQRSIHYPYVGDLISPSHISNVHHIDIMIIITTVTYTLARHLQIYINL